jgi:hypothetical protein
MGPALGRHLQLGLESLSRLAKFRFCRFGALGTPAGVGYAEATATLVGAGGSADVESN